MKKRISIEFNYSVEIWNKSESLDGYINSSEDDVRKAIKTLIKEGANVRIIDD